MPSLVDQYCHALVYDELAPQQIQGILAPLGFSDWRAAGARLVRIGQKGRNRDAFATILPLLLSALPKTGNADQVLASLERLVESASADRDLLSELASSPRVVEILVTLFSGSQFLTEILLRNPGYIELLSDLQELAEPRTTKELLAAARDWLQSAQTYRERINALRRFQRRQLLRIGIGDLLGLLDLVATTLQLSLLAESIIQACVELAASHTGEPSAGFLVVAMGKLGGQELNYSSDIDLVFLSGNDLASHTRLARRLIDALSLVTEEGFLYRVDMRLRPWGQVGALVSSLAAYRMYLELHARPWEKQALVKARAVAGSAAVGKAFDLAVVNAVYVRDAQPREEVRAMKQRAEQELRRQGRQWGEIKLGEGSIRDIEFIAQALQLEHGAAHPKLRTGNTLEALSQLAAHGLLSSSEMRTLVDGYVFFRTIEHHLQMMHYRQTHRLPGDSTALGQLARRLGFLGLEAGDEFTKRYEEHREAIRALYRRHLEGEMMHAPAADQTEKPRDVEQHLVRMAPSYLTSFSPEEIRRHAAMAESLDDDTLVRVHTSPLQDGRWRVTIVAYDYPGELSLICGLLFVHHLGIQDGNVFTYEPTEESPASFPRLPRSPGRATSPRVGTRRAMAAPEADRRKIVDVFTVSPDRGEVSADFWSEYRADLAELLRLMHLGRRDEAQSILAKRVAAALHDVVGLETTLYPVDIEIDNQLSERYTALRIEAPDTTGFLYELTNALAFNRIYIARVVVGSVGSTVQDVLFVTDENGAKVESEERQRELRAATVLVKHFTHLLPSSPNPESALLHFREFLAQLFRRPDWPNELASLERAEFLRALAHLLGVSDFLWDDFLRMQYANLFPVVTDLDALKTAKSRAQLQEELEEALLAVHSGPQPPSEDAPWRETLNAFKDREMFRIDMRHILGHTQEFVEFSAELTDLAEVIVNSAYHLCHEDLRSVYGTPCLADGSVSDMSVCALGKFGGCELGFASDVELLFVYSGNGQTTGPNVISTAEFYERVVETFVSAIKAKREGIFEVDLRLRPYGNAGSMAVSLESFRRYFNPEGSAWAYERQALVKLRPVAGGPGLGQRIVTLRDGFVYTGVPFDTTAMRAMRERQIRHLVAGGTFNAKYSPGGLVDVEYLVQGLQITHGAELPELRLTNIRDAMAALHHTGIISDDDYSRLRRAHTFLRWLIDGLRMVRGNARDLTVPTADAQAFAYLAKRLRYDDRTDQLRGDLDLHTSAVLELASRLLN